jgi:hypothetical protein
MFSRNATTTSELMDGVPTPPGRPGHLLKDLLGIEVDFSSFIARYENLEIGIGAFIAKVGFNVHLVDYLDATDEKHGSAIKEGEYESIRLVGWTAIRFCSTNQ